VVDVGEQNLHELPTISRAMKSSACGTAPAVVEQRLDVGDEVPSAGRIDCRLAPAARRPDVASRLQSRRRWRFWRHRADEGAKSRSITSPNFCRDSAFRGDQIGECAKLSGATRYSQ
jgi:hypothetical protein